MKLTSFLVPICFTNIYFPQVLAFVILLALKLYKSKTLLTFAEIFLETVGLL